MDVVTTKLKTQCVTYKYLIYTFKPYKPINNSFEGAPYACGAQSEVL
jgi:hypothetical protein